MNIQCTIDLGSGELSLSRCKALGVELGVSQKEVSGGRQLEILLINKSKNSFFLSSAALVLTGFDAPAQPDWRVFIDQGVCAWMGVKRLDDLHRDKMLHVAAEQAAGRREEDELPYHRSSLQSVLWDAAGRHGYLFGFLAQHNGKNFIEIHPDASKKQPESVAARQHFGYELKPGERQKLDPFVILEGGSPYGLLETFGELVKAGNPRNFDRPPIVGMMTWYGCGTDLRGESCLKNAEMIGELFGGYPQPMKNLLLLDHGWQTNAAWGHLQPEPGRFPADMKQYRDALAQYGVGLGMWHTPFCLTADSPNFEQIKGLRALDKNGEPQRDYACVWGAREGEVGGLHELNLFDAALPEVQDKWSRELRQLRDWGVEYAKLDFFILRKSENNTAVSEGQLNERTWNTFRSAAGEEMLLSPCSCDTNQQIGHCDTMRIGSDIGTAGRWPGAAQFALALSTMAASWYKHRRFWINDFDSVQLAKGCSLGEARVRATAVAFGGGHLMLSEELRQVSADRVELFRRLLPAQPDAARPLDLFEAPYPDGYPAVWQLSCGAKKALALFNLDGATRRFAISPEMFGFAKKDEILVLEWWNCRWLGRHKGEFFVDVAPEDVAVLHAVKVKRNPQIVSVSHHPTGAYILENVRFSAKTGRLTGDIVTKAGLNLTLFGSLGEWTLHPSHQHRGTENSCGGWQLEITTKAQRTPFCVCFEKIQSDKGEAHE